MCCLTKDAAKKLLSAGANVNQKDRNGATAIMWQFDPAVTLLLISKGAQCDLLDSERNSTVARTANNLFYLKSHQRGTFGKLKNLDVQYAKLLRKLVAMGSGVDSRLPEHEMSPLMIMAKLDLQKSANVLVNAGTAISATDRKGQMAWQHAPPKSALRKKLKPKE